MQVFITGGTGYFGSVLVEHLGKAGHRVTALARTDRAAQQLDAAGAVPVHGSLADTDVLRDAAAGADAVIHAAVDYSATEEAVSTELAAVAALVAGAGAARAAKPVLYTSTGLVYGFGAKDTREEVELPEVSAQPVKAAAERLVLGADGITGIVVRASLIFGRGGSGLVTGLIRAATATGVSAYIDEGATTWFPIHVDDLAELYVRAIERPAAGAFNAAGDVPFTFKELAGAIAALTGTTATSVPYAVAEQTMGPGARIMTAGNRLSTAKARAAFGWAPRSRSLIDDVRDGSYAPPKAS